MFLAFDWPRFFEYFFGILFFVGLISVASILLIRNLRASYKEVYKYQSKFDIELRKCMNLMSKTLKTETLKVYDNVVVKQLSHEEKKTILMLVEEVYEQTSMKAEQHAYILETYQNLQEARRIRDSKVLMFNQRISLFPFNIYARIMKFGHWEVYTKTN